MNYSQKIELIFKFDSDINHVFYKIHHIQIKCYLNSVDEIIGLTKFIS